jgi:outer membrane receptor for ferrienterochelin and colicins
MSRNTPRLPWRTLLPALVLALCPALAHAQTGSVRGTVTGPGGEALAAAQVSIVGARFAATTDAGGGFVLRGVPAGTHSLRVSQLGFAEVVREVSVRAGEETVAHVQLETRVLALDALVLSASRRMERRSEAPATVTRVGADVLDNLAGTSFTGALKQATGLDYAQVGVTSVAINARGFNSSFNNRMLMLEDGRIAVLPENGLPVGGFTPIPKVDLAAVEVIVGPGSALYGADASNGVLTLQSKDPRDFPGTTLELTGGTREYVDVQARHAGVSGKLGYKLSGEFLRFEDWSNRIRATAAPTSPWETSVGDTAGLNWSSRVARSYGGLSYYEGNAKFELNAGYSITDGVGQTNVGRNQLVGWTYNVVQARATLPNWYFSAYRTQSQAGDSYAANRYTTNRANPALGNLSDEEIRKLSDWPSNGQLYAAEVQNTFGVPQLLGTSVTWGGQFRHDVVSSDREWLTDRLTGKDLTVSQWGTYAQSETRLFSGFRALLAGRYDNHENYDAQFSPKAGVLFSPVEGHTLRLFYNRAFKSPSTLQTNFYIPNFVPTVGVFGNREGFVVRNAQGTVIREYGPMVPERNETWELGYKALVQGRFFVDVTGYHSVYENFMSPLTAIAIPAIGTRAYRPDGSEVTDEAGNSQLVLTYFNLGEATIYGMDAAMTFVATPRLDLTGTVSLLKLDEIRGIDTNIPGELEATAMNSPTTKWSLGASMHDVGPFLGGATFRYVNGYRFTSGINAGRIPTFSTLDLNLGYRLPVSGAQLNLSASNLFTCRSANPSLPDDERKCGFGVKHTEMVNMPEIGTMVFLGVRFNTH